MDQCCKAHDRLDLKLHQLEYRGMMCGTDKHQHEFPPNMGGVPQANGDGTPKLVKEYCCSQCPTLVSDIKSS